eukprot:g7406.t1
MKRTVPNRAFDHLYDPVYTSGTTRSSSSTNTVGSSHLNQGTQRYKYFKKPLIPYLESNSPTVVLAKREDAMNDESSSKNQERRPGEKTRTVGVQTKYRDSEAQTDPFTPKFILKPGKSRPEVLSISNLTFSNGLPAGLREIQSIEHAREKRAYEASLPPMTDEVSFTIRRKLMERQEREEFNRREAAIEEANREHLRMIRNALEERERLNESKREHRVDTLRMSKLVEKDRLVSEVYKKRTTKLRKLSNRRQISESKLYNPKQTRNVIRDYTNYGSNVYAPIKRLGATMPSQQTLIAHHEADMSLNSLSELEHSLPNKLVSMSIPEPIVSMKRKELRPINTKMRKEQSIRMHLERTARSLAVNDDTIKSEFVFETTKNEDEADDDDEEEDDDEIVVSTKTTERADAEDLALQRPPTPDINDENDDENEAYEAERTAHAITILQKLLRGRAVQNIMHEGVSENRDLIAELRHEDDRIEESVGISSSSSCKNDDDEEDLQWQHNEVIQSTREKLVGEIVSSAVESLKGGVNSSGLGL